MVLSLHVNSPLLKNGALRVELHARTHEDRKKESIKQMVSRRPRNLENDE